GWWLCVGVRRSAANAGGATLFVLVIAPGAATPS
ncbi:MAG: hypothetical protein QOC94_1017, partial [Actinoplanes sp.]|nr:hypothetical protein [Actinoplanes sp.]